MTLAVGTRVRSKRVGALSEFNGTIKSVHRNGTLEHRGFSEFPTWYYTVQADNGTEWSRYDDDLTVIEMSQLDPLYARFGQADTLEALSGRYVATAMVLKLTSGRFAIFSADRELWTIVDRWDLSADLIEKVPAPKPPPKVEREEYKSTVDPLLLGLEL